MAQNCDRNFSKREKFPHLIIVLLVDPCQTSSSAIMTFKLPEFSMSKEITWKVDMDSGKLEELGYDMIIGRDLLQDLKVVIDFEYQDTVGGCQYSHE